MMIHPPLSLRLTGIVAMGENRVIGKNNQLPWRLPADLKHFKRLTTGHPILMGRKTFESIGRPLPDRTNIILTRDPTYSMPGCVVVTSLKDALAHAVMLESREVFVIGGAEIYRQTLPSLSRLYLTIVHHFFDGDAFFPELAPDEWKEISREFHHSDVENPYDYSFVMLERQSTLNKRSSSRRSAVRQLPHTQPVSSG